MKASGHSGRCALTALPGDFYLRVPLVDPRGVLSLIDEPMVMVDGLEPDHFPGLDILEPEEADVGAFPIEVRTVLALEKEQLTPWLTELCSVTTEARGLSQEMSDDDIAGVLYWGEEARWRLRRICIGRYSRFEELADTSELDSLGAFRDWLLVQGNQTFAFTCFTNGWGEYNTTDAAGMLDFLQRWLSIYADLVQMQQPEAMIAPPIIDRKALAKALAELTARGRGQQRWEWELAPR